MTRRRCAALCLLTAVCSIVPAGSGCQSSSQPSALSGPIGIAPSEIRAAHRNQQISRGNMHASDGLGSVIFAPEPTQPAVANVPTE